MATVLLDTDVFTFFFKSDSRATAYASLLQGQHLALSFMTVAELYQWTQVRKWGAKRVGQLEQALTAYAILPSDDVMCRLWAQVRSERQSSGRPISYQDAWVAETALRYNLPLVTHNVNDFTGITGLDVRTATSP
jgi:tRNA(fMet)-specific endonuclease VapC